jgi:catechol-2,3-dioxygenase
VGAFAVEMPMAASRPRLLRVLETALYHGAGQDEAVRDFYEHVLGLRPVSQWRKGAAYRVGDSLVLVFDREKTTRQQLPHGASGSGHACFVTPPDDYERWKEHLRLAAVEVIEETDYDGIRSLYFRDPAGNVLEIAEGDMWPP